MLFTHLVFLTAGISLFIRFKDLFLQGFVQAHSIGIYAPSISLIPVNGENIF